jgi:hypothetical protein
LGLDVGRMGYLAGFIPVGAVFGLILLGVNYRSWLGGVLLLVAEVIGIWFLLHMLRRRLREFK